MYSKAKIKKYVSESKDRSSLSSLLQLLFHREHHSYHQDHYRISKVEIVMVSQMNFLLKILSRCQLYHVNYKLKIVEVRISSTFRDFVKVNIKNIERYQMVLAAIVEYKNVIKLCCCRSDNNSVTHHAMMTRTIL